MRKRITHVRSDSEVLIVVRVEEGKQGKEHQHAEIHLPYFIKELS